MMARMIRTGVRFCLRLLVCASLVSGCKNPPAIGADVAVLIDGEEIHYAAFEAYLRANVAGDESSLESAVQDRLFDQFLDEQLLIRLAIERGMVEPDLDQRRAVAFLLRGEPQQVWTEAELKAYYKAHEPKFRREEEVHLRQILVHERSDAEKALKAIAAGEDFSQVAARFSQAPNAQLGGDQGRLSRSDLPAAYADAIFELPAGEVTGIVAADYGFHLFEVVARFPAELAPFDQVKGEIRRTLERKRIDGLIESFVHEARERYNVTVFPANFPFDYQGDYLHGDAAHEETEVADDPTETE